jgi:RNA recognition motif-containing protein
MKLYVGNLKYEVTSDQLAELFGQAGEVIDVVAMMDKYTGRSRGFGFVEMNDEDGKRAIEMFNGYEFQGRALQVNEARPKRERSERGGGGGYGGGNRGGGYQQSGGGYNDGGYQQGY